MFRQPEIAMTQTEDQAWVEAEILARRALIAARYTPVMAGGQAPWRWGLDSTRQSQRAAQDLNVLASRLTEKVEQVQL